MTHPASQPPPGGPSGAHSGTTDPGSPDAGARRSGPVLLVLAAIASVQFGGALAATLIPRLGFLGTVALRLGIGAVVLLAVVRPNPRGHSRAAWLTAIAFGVALGGMNTTFYAALAHLPLGVAVTVEFLGPLVLSASLSRHTRDAVAVAAAALGVVLISRVTSVSLDQIDLVGMLCALGAGVGWAAYILLSARTGRYFTGTDGLAWAMTTAGVILVPAALASGLADRLDTDALLRGAGVAMLSAVLPYSLELAALRHLSARIFGVLMSLEPAVAALAGLLILGQRLDVVQVVGMALVVGASAVVTLGSPARED